VPEPLISFRFPGGIKVQCVFTTRQGGVSRGPYASANLSHDVGDADRDVLANRTSLIGGLGFSTWHELQQVHSTRLVFDPPASGFERTVLSGDGMATSTTGQALVIKTADCQPILVAHRSGSHIAALHCGWRGNLAGFPTSSIREFCSRYGLDPAELLAVRGPSLSPDRAEFVHHEREWGSGFSEYFDRLRQTMDLWRLTTDQLLAGGLPRESIFSIDLCTYQQEDLFFSYRRSKVCGRQAGIIWKEEQ
jgi:polyphenol oxidase